MIDSDLMFVIVSCGCIVVVFYLLILGYALFSALMDRLDRKEERCRKMYMDDCEKEDK